MDKIRVVLVNPKYSQNVGMVARAMKNFGFSDLRLVNPRCELDEDAYARAVVRAWDILASSRTHQRFEEAIKGCGLVIGTSRRMSARKKNIIGPKEMVELLKQALPANKVALVFGSEDLGLSNQEVKHCQWIVGIHPGTEFESLNLSHAVAIILYEIVFAIGSPVESRKKLADTLELERMYAHLEDVLTEIGFIEEGDPRRMMLSFRSLFNRAMLTPREVKMVRGMLRQVRWRIERAKKLKV